MKLKKHFEMKWKVIFHATEKDWRLNIFTEAEFDNLKDAADFTTMKIGNHLGLVRIVHPKN